jgi:hypothetical protein
MVGFSHRSEQRDDNHQPNDTMIATQNTSRLRVGDSVRLSTPWSDGSVVAYWAKCYRVTDDGRAGIQIPAKVMALRFPPFATNRVLIKNAVAETSIKRA